MFRLLNQKKGITLIELLITLALIGIVIAIILSLQLFSLSAFSKGDDQSNIQDRIRLAAGYITKELRNAYTIEILNSMPATKDIQKRYFYISDSDNKIKYYFSGVEKDVLSSSLPNSTLTITFHKDSINPKVLNYTINAIYKGQNYNITSAVFPKNISNTDDIKNTDGFAISFSSPLTDVQTVNADKLLLELRDYNLILHQESDGSLTLDPPTPNRLMLIPMGKNGSTISWSSSDVNIVKNDGTVIRPGVDKSDKTVKLTATLSKGSATTTKDFTVKIKALLNLVLNTGYTGSPLTETITIGNVYQHNFAATGGTGVYTFSMTPTILGDSLSTHGLTLNVNGVLGGTITGPAGSYKYTITVKDDFPIPNEDSQSVTLVIN